MIGAALSAAAVRDPEEARRRFDREFSAQIFALKRHDCPKMIVRTLEKKRPQVIARAGGMIPSGSKRVSFLPIIPSNRLSVREQLSMVKNGNIPGCTRLDTAYITNLELVPEEEYFIFSIEDGTKTLGWTPIFGEKVFKAQPNRRGLSVPEIISLCRHTDVISRQNIDAILSKLKDKVPFLWLVEREPRLCADKMTTSDPRWGIPSCNSVVI
ncbi:MAG: hypothetical protein Q7S78_01415 [Candidatus Azambacteria bacterium]|nr:hypothetical protein [Candidatus Azambacteria bacterium]